VITPTKLDEARKGVHASVDKEFDALADLLVSPTKTIHLILVTYLNQSPWDDYMNALKDVPAEIDAWLRPQKLQAVNWAVRYVALPNRPNTYGFVSLVDAVRARTGLTAPDKDNALYLFSQDPDGELIVYGTLGGDVLGGPRFPGVSYFMIPGLHALAYNTDHPVVGKTDGWTHNRALGAICHELGRNLAGLRCADCPHAERCVMRQWWRFPDCEYEEKGYVFGTEPCPKGNEREALVASGFMRKV
jgi:hypothetical protein